MKRKEKKRKRSAGYTCDYLNPQEGPLVLEPGPVFAKDGDKNRSEQISYRILRGLI